MHLAAQLLEKINAAADVKDEEEDLPADLNELLDDQRQARRSRKGGAAASAGAASGGGGAHALKKRKPGSMSLLSGDDGTQYAESERRPPAPKFHSAFALNEEAKRKQEQKELKAVMSQLRK
jgi:hypothetical protein